MSKIEYETLPKCVGIVGSRSFEDHVNGSQKVWENIDLFVRSLKPGTLIVSGGARGVDKWAEEAADNYKFPKHIIYPSKEYPVPQRFFMRNTDIVVHVSSYEGVIAAFIDIDSCNGTTDTIKKAIEMGVPVMVFRYTQDGRFFGWSKEGDWPLTPET